MVEQPKYSKVFLRFIERRIQARMEKDESYSELLEKLEQEDPVGAEIVKRNLGGNIGDIGADARAVLYNGLSQRDKKAVIRVFGIRQKAGEFDEDIIQDKVKCLEEVARGYISQTCAFEDVLTKKGYEPVSEVLRNHDVGIACLSSNGRLMLFGKIGRHGRPFNAKGLHSPGLTYENAIAYPENDLRLGESSSVIVVKPSAGFTTSCLRGLAINPNVGNEPGADYARTIMHGFDETYRNMFASKVEELRESYKELKVEF